VIACLLTDMLVMPVDTRQAFWTRGLRRGIEMGRSAGGTHHAFSRRIWRQRETSARAQRKRVEGRSGLSCVEACHRLGTLAPETPIDKNEWCALFEVSKLSITTAINRLAFEGLVEVEPQRGSYVATIHLEDVRQWMRCVARWR
jgi:hypothetical protein